MSMKTKVQTEWHGDEVIKDFDKAQFKSLFQGANLVLNDAVTTVAVDKGQLKQSLVKVVKPDKATIGTPVSHTPHVEFGTRPHTIPNAFGKGITVNHPGTKAQPFLLPALINNVKKIIALFKTNGINLKWVNK